MQRTSSAAGSGGVNQAERKLARQRQMEMMEAVASGTAPTMELDVGGLEHDVMMTSPRMSSETMAAMAAAPSTSSDTTGLLAPSSTTGGGPPTTSVRTSDIFHRPQQPMTSVNLMDHDRGVYQENKPKSSGWSSMWGSGEKDMYDASPAHHDDYYLGRDGTSKTGEKRASPFVAWCRKYRWWIFLVLLLLIGLIAMTTLLVTLKPQEALVHQHNEFRYESLYETIVQQGVTHPDVLHNESTAEYHALRWMAFTDPGRVDSLADAKGALQRYALAVFFYSSWLSFEEFAGKQQPIEHAGGEDQFEGVPNPGWRRRDYWMSTRGYCDWYGVECKPIDVDGTGRPTMKYNDNGDIVTIDLTENHVYGTIPPEFRILESLTYVGLSNNKLEGTFPPQVGRMFQVQYLLLNDNSMTGSLPTWVGMMQDVREIRLSSNYLTGSVPKELGNLVHLQHVGLQNNALNGTVPDLLNLAQLETLNLGNNELSGPIPASFGTSLVELQELHLHNNSLTGGLPAELGQLQQLRLLNLEYNALTASSIPETLFEGLSPSLEYLNLQHNALKGPLPASLGRLSVLETLQLNHNEFTGPLPAWQDLASLTMLQLQNNQLTGSIPGAEMFSGMTQLADLYLDNNQFGGNLPDTAWTSSTTPNLKRLYLETNPLIDGPVPGSLATLQSLESLRLFETNLSGEMPAALCQMQTSKQYHLQSITADCKEPGAKIQCSCCVCH